MENKDLIGKTIQEIEITGYGITLVTTDGMRLEYNASDGGYSSWTIEKDE